MEENKKNRKEEIQSRREFFKRVAMGALPILGGIVLSNIPLIGRAHESEVENGCDWDCSGGCKGSCGRVCSYGCTNSCSGGCDGACKGGCSSSCKGYCAYSSSF